MIDYIKRENLPSCMGTDSDYSDGWDDCLLSIKDIPAADVRENVHAHWIEVNGETGVEAFGYREYTTLFFYCSKCNGEIDVCEGGYKFCPYCGAIMDEEVGG